MHAETPCTVVRNDYKLRRKPSLCYRKLVKKSGYHVYFSSSIQHLICQQTLSVVAAATRKPFAFNNKIKIQVRQFTVPIYESPMFV